MYAYIFGITRTSETVFFIMILRPPRSTRTATLFPDTALFRSRRTATRMARPGSAAVEGLYPPSPKWSGRSSARIDVANDYIQAKETAIVCRWLEQEFNAYVGSVVVAKALAGGPGTRRNAMTAPFGSESAMRGFADDLEGRWEEGRVGKEGVRMGRARG